MIAVALAGGVVGAGYNLKVCLGFVLHYLAVDAGFTFHVEARLPASACVRAP